MLPGFVFGPRALGLTILLGTNAGCGLVFDYGSYGPDGGGGGDGPNTGQGPGTTGASSGEGGPGSGGSGPGSGGSGPGSGGSGPGSGGSGPGSGGSGPGSGGSGPGSGGGGAGGASGCTDPSQCPGIESDCGARTCIDGACGIDATPAGTLVDPQTGGDCSKRVCDGQGNIVDAADPTDPQDDGKDCTTDVCVDGETTHEPEPVTARCGSGAETHCDGAGNCVGCIDDTECPASTDCATWTCSVDQACEVTPETGTPCGEGARCSNGSAKAPDTCDALGACIGGSVTSCAPYVCSAGATCLTSCQGVGDAQCAGGYYCVGAQCQPKKPNGNPCSGANECTSGICAGGTCCDQSCAGGCETCASGACLAVPSGQDPKGACSGADTCNGNRVCFCNDGVSNNGEPRIDCQGVCPDLCVGQWSCDCGALSYGGAAFGGCCPGSGCTSCVDDGCKNGDDCTGVGSTQGYGIGYGIDHGGCPGPANLMCAQYSCTCQ